MSRQPKPFDVLLVFDESSERAARELQSRLGEAGLRPAVDLSRQLDLDGEPLENWPNALGQASACVVVLGKDATKFAREDLRCQALREWSQLEDTLLIFVLLPGFDATSNLPNWMARYPRVDFTLGLGDRETFAQLVSLINTHGEPADLLRSGRSSVSEESIHLASTRDQPTHDDRLGFQPYVDAIAEFLVSEDTRPPLTLSIEGEWGSGKSSFMLMLERALHARVMRDWHWDTLPLPLAWLITRHERPHSEPPRRWRWFASRPARLWQVLIERGSAEVLEAGFLRRLARELRPPVLTRLRRALRYPCCLTVPFNAWRHDREDALWAAFALEFLRRIRRQRSFPLRLLGDLRLFFRRYRWVAGGLELVRWVGAWSAFVCLLVLALVASPFATAGLARSQRQSGRERICGSSS